MDETVIIDAKSLIFKWEAAERRSMLRSKTMPNNTFSNEAFEKHVKDPLRERMVPILLTWTFRWWETE